MHQDIYGSGLDHSDSDGILLRTQLTPIYDANKIDVVLQLADGEQVTANCPNGLLFGTVCEPGMQPLLLYGLQLRPHDGRRRLPRLLRTSRNK